LRAQEWLATEAPALPPPCATNVEASGHAFNCWVEHHVGTEDRAVR
jgi:hypothetical protein